MKATSMAWPLRAQIYRLKCAPLLSSEALHHRVVVHPSTPSLLVHSNRSSRSRYYADNGKISLVMRRNKAGANTPNTPMKHTPNHFRVGLILHCSIVNTSKTWLEINYYPTCHKAKWRRYTPGFFSNYLEKIVLRLYSSSV